MAKITAGATWQQCGSSRIGYGGKLLAEILGRSSCCHPEGTNNVASAGVATCGGLAIAHYQTLAVIAALDRMDVLVKN
jgi:hypothetical protein